MRTRTVSKLVCHQPTKSHHIKSFLQKKSQILFFFPERVFNLPMMPQRFYLKSRSHAFQKHFHLLLNHSINPSIKSIKSINQSIKSIDQINRSIKQSIDQSINQSNQSRNQSINGRCGRDVQNPKKPFKKHKALMSGRRGCGRDVQNSKKLLKA